MGMNVTNASNAYTSAAQQYDNYSMTKEEVDSIKERIEDAKNQPPQDYSKEAEVFFSHEGVQALYASKNSWANAKDADTVGQGMWNDYLKSESGSNYKNMNSSDKAESLLNFYKDKYDEIEKGYADGTRQVYVRDYSTHTLRLMTKEEELDQLNKLYNKESNKIANQRRDEMTGELIKQGKLDRWDAHLNEKNKPKQSMPVNETERNTPDDIKDFIESNKDKSASQIMDEGLSFIENFRSSLMNVPNIFSQQFGTQSSGLFDITGFLNNLTAWK